MLGLPYGRELIVIGSNFGRRAHPGWYHNLRKHPLAAITHRGVTTAVSARLLEGEERERCCAAAAAIYPGFADYRRRAAHRKLGVFRLSPA